MEHIVASLLIDGYLKEDFHYTPYNTISYLLPGNRTNIRKPLMMSVPQPKGVKRKLETPKVIKRKEEKTTVIDVSDSGSDFDWIKYEICLLQDKLHLLYFLKICPIFVGSVDNFHGFF